MHLYAFNRPEYEKMYNFTLLACQLNEPEEDVAPTDSRLRPDQRLMEDGQWDEANQVKVLLEDKQRAVRRKREEEAEQAASEGYYFFPSFNPLSINLFKYIYIYMKHIQFLHDWIM